jgi:hypothetical protein
MNIPTMTSSINAKKKKLKQPKRLQVQFVIGTFPWAHCTTCLDEDY